MKIFIALILSACILFQAHLSHAQSTSLDGLYVTTFENGVVYPLKEGETCPFNDNWPHMEGCIEITKTSNVLGLVQNQDTNILNFSVSLAFFNGHSCQLSGQAQRQDDNEWLFTEMYDTADDDLKSAMNCALTIKTTDKSIILNSSEQASCRMNCGARGHFSNITFPIKSKKTDVITLDDLNCIGIVSDSCNNTVR